MARQRGMVVIPKDLHQILIDSGYSPGRVAGKLIREFLIQEGKLPAEEKQAA